MTDRLFAIRDLEIPSIPWDLIGPHEGRALEAHFQTLDRIDRRGGLCPSEAVAVIEERAYRWMTPVEARQTLRGYVDQHRVCAGA